MPKYEKLQPCPKCGETETLTHDAHPGFVTTYRHVRCECGYIGPGRHDSVQAVKAFNRVKRENAEYSSRSLRNG